MKAKSIRPQPGERWRHWKGYECVILVEACEESTGRAVVVYRYPDTGNVWTRPLSDFVGMVKRYDKPACPRFVRLGKR